MKGDVDDAIPYVASLWDRHYGFKIANLLHKDRVNAVAVNPRHENMVRI